MSGVSLRMMLAILASGDAYYFGGVAVLTDRLAQQVPESQIGPLNLLVVEHVGGKSPKPYEVRPVGQDGPHRCAAALKWSARTSLSPPWA